VAITAPRPVLAIPALVTIAAGALGVPVAKTLCACGFEDPTAESATAAKLLTDKFDAGAAQLVIVVLAPDGYGSVPARAVGTEIVDQLARFPHLARIGRVVTAAELVMSI
jgi:putative drug exporter of the RND superfamily